MEKNVNLCFELNASRASAIYCWPEATRRFGIRLNAIHQYLRIDVTIISGGGCGHIGAGRIDIISALATML